jgi:phospholipid/cholesterol/gamma-HCH transport system substrate-binding protein
MKRRDEVLVGLLLLVALTIGVAGTIWLVRGGFRSGYSLAARFRWGENLKVGQPVRLAGVQVGYVGDVQLRDDGTLGVELKIEEGRKIPRNARAIVQPVGIFGDAEVALQATPGGPAYAEGDTVPAGVAPAGITQLTAKGDSVATIAVDLSRRVQAQLVDSGGLAEVRQTLARTNALVAQLSRIAAEQNRQLSATQAQVRRTLAAVDPVVVDSTLRSVRATAANATLLTDSLRATSAQINATLARLSRGEGTAGKLLSDTLLYSDLRRLVVRIDSLTLDFQKNPRRYINLEIF